jgi:hypothetical protein
MRIPRRLLGSFAVLLFATACDPCAGVLACEDPAIRAEGMVVLHVTGDFAPRAVVNFTVVDDDGAPIDTLRTMTGLDGIFHLAAPAPAGRDHIVGVLTVFGPPLYSSWAFSVGDVRLPVVDRRGDAHYLGVFGVGPFRSRAPHLSYDLLFARSDTGAPAEGLAVRVEQIGGVEVKLQSDTMTTDSLGRARLRGTAASDGDSQIRLHVSGDAYRAREFTAWLTTLRGEGEVGERRFTVDPR